MKKRIAILAAAAFLALAVSAYAASSGVVYDATPKHLPPNVTSLGFQATQTNEFGDYVHLGGTDRRLHSVTVTMSDWARYSEYASDSRYSSDHRHWRHAITVNIYSSHLDANGVPDQLLGSVTQTVSIPWRPEGDPTCPDTGYGAGFAWRASDGQCYNGLAFNAKVDFSSQHVRLPDGVIVGIAYNTQSYGTAPIGVNGPYNSLNVGVPQDQKVRVGSDDSPDEVFWNTSNANNYTDHGAGGVGTFRKDTNWSPYGTVAIKLTATVIH